MDCLHYRETPVCSSALFSVFFCFPQEPLKLSEPGNSYMFPRGSPNIQGIKRHLACKSLFFPRHSALPFISPSLLLSLSSQQCKHSIFDFTLGGLIPFASPSSTSYWSVFNLCVSFWTIMHHGIQGTPIANNLFYKWWGYRYRYFFYSSLRICLVKKKIILTSSLIFLLFVSCTKLIASKIIVSVNSLKSSEVNPFWIRSIFCKTYSKVDGALFVLQIQNETSRPPVPTFNALLLSEKYHKQLTRGRKLIMNSPQWKHHVLSVCIYDSSMVFLYNPRPLCFGRETIYISTSLLGHTQLHCLTVRDDGDKTGIGTYCCSMEMCVCVCDVFVSAVYEPLRLHL